MFIIQKEELIRKLKDSIFWEDDFIAKYDTESVQALIDTLPKEKKGKVKALLAENILDTKKHRDFLNELMDKIKKGNKDEY